MKTNEEIVNLDEIHPSIIPFVTRRSIQSSAYPDDFMKNIETDTSLKIFTIQVTDRCNLCCDYCFQTNKGTSILTFETGKKMIDILLSLTPKNCEYINCENTKGIMLDFIGGEPFLEVDLMDQICEYCISQMQLKNHPWKDSFRIGAGTNGTLYFTDKVQKFVNKYKDYLRMTFSVDGNKKLHDTYRRFPDGSGSYDIAVKAYLHYSKNFDPSSNIKLTLAPNGLPYLYDALINMINLGSKVLQMAPVLEKGWTVDHAKDYYHQLRKIADYILDNDLESTVYLNQFNGEKYTPSNTNDNWCGIGNDMQLFSMDLEGNIYNCIRLAKTSVDNREPLSIGNVDEGIAVSKKSHAIIRTMKGLTRRSVSTDKCYYCPIARSCGWCCANSYKEFGTLNARATYTCDMRIAESLANNYFLNKYAEKQVKNGDISYCFRRAKLYCPYDWAIRIINENEYDMLLDISHMRRRVVR